MKNILYLFVIALLFSCKKDSSPYSNEFAKSKQSWVAYKASVNNSYSYISYHSSVFGGYVETKITVQNGKVTGRSYLMGIYTQGPSPTLQIKTSWTENTNTLNTHQEGAEAITLDDIYAMAPNQWLSADKKNNDIFFEAENDGLISSCGYVPKGCQDDCFNGVYIKSITAL